MSRRLAMNSEGQMTYCTASEENIGKGRCNHIVHQNPEESPEDFCERANKTLELERLANSTWYAHRVNAAEAGYALDKLVNDESWYVRYAVASQGCGLDKLINDENEDVRALVARQRYGLDKLINDPNPWVRMAVAEQDYGLDKLINDEKELVRNAVANQGYGLDKLSKDSSDLVSFSCDNWLKDHNMTIEEYTQKVEETGGYDWVKDFY